MMKKNVIADKIFHPRNDKSSTNAFHFCPFIILRLHVLKELREKSNLPVIILSAKTADNDKILGLDLGADDYIAKPFNPLEAVVLSRFKAVTQTAHSPYVTVVII